MNDNDPRRFLDPMDGGPVLPAPDIDLTNPRSPEWKRVRWSPADLDRCEHGRHSIDSCFDCPGGQSHGNPFLLSAHSGHLAIQLNDSQSEIRVRQTEGGRFEVRIGTMVRGEPIWAVVRDRPRGADVEDDNTMRCGECGHQVVPGLHTEAECITNQQNDAAEASQTEEQTDGE
jgi:hypothetical protein